MNKKHLARQVSERLGLSADDASRIVDALVAVVTQGLRSDGKVLISEFGTFQVIEREPRWVRNPRNLRPVWVPGSRRPMFKPARWLRDEVGSTSFRD